MVWGIFKKVVIADRIGIFVSEVYNAPSESYGVINIIATILFSFQLYLDFSSYSEIAIGSARIFGYKLSINFIRPYLSVSFKDFWKRWHITLNAWFFEYLYLPLGGNKKKGITTIRNIIIIFLVSGLWHGASWNFVIWGGINSIYLLVIDRFLQSKKKKKKKLFGKIFFGTIIMLLWSASLVFFRANTSLA
jgi:D-alanyl-lipoteichoic acid acyltransferase DltB (MBOAT superfamily)